MKLVIAEKPSVAREIATVLSADKKEHGYLTGNDYIVSWCIGHLITSANPEIYNKDLKSWSLESLPIIPENFKYSINAQTSDQYKILKNLMLSSEVTEIICATDAGREGELIFRLVYNQTGCKKPFKRLWISSMETTAIKEGFNNLKASENYDNLYKAATCRLNADWLTGINLTRFYSCIYGKKLNVGRVQTPTINIIVKREKEIINFIPKSYYLLTATLSNFTATKKVDTLKEAENIISKCFEKEAYVTQVINDKKEISPPKLYDLTTLQREANRFYGFTAQQTLNIAQSLYEKKLITYPRTDSNYITNDMEDFIKKCIDRMVSKGFFEDYNFDLMNIQKIINNKKVTDHHAIVPTLELVDTTFDNLSMDEKLIYTLIAYKLLAASYSKHIYTTTKIIFDIEGESFTSNGKTIIEEGFKVIERIIRQSQKEDNNSEEALANLPQMNEGNIFLVQNIIKNSKQTQPPKRYTEDTLLTAMETAGKNISEDALKDAIKDKGLGTPATRANIIEKIISSGYIERDKKSLLPTEQAKVFMYLISSELKEPELTAQWEFQLSLIEKGELDPNIFMNEIKGFLHNFISDYKMLNQNNTQETKQVFGNKEREVIGVCPICEKNVVENQKAYSCSSGKGGCGFVIWKTIASKDITKTQAKKLITSGKTDLIKGFTSKAGKKFDAMLILKEDNTVSFNFS